MATNLERRLEDLEKQLEWLDTERRQNGRKLAELEQKITLQEREIGKREQRIQQLEKQLSTTNAQLSRIPQVDTQLAKFRDEMVKLIDQYDARRLASEQESDRLRRVEHESIVREIGTIRKELPAIIRLQEDMELRQTEENRLAGLIAQQKNQMSALDNRIENFTREYGFIDEREKQNRRAITEMQTDLLDVNKRWDGVAPQLELLRNQITRTSSDMRQVEDVQEKVTKSLNSWLEQIQIGEHERNKKVENVRYTLDEQNAAIERFRKEWIPVMDLFKEAKLVLDTLGGWQEQVENQQKQASELLRVESNRLQSRWDNFALELEKQLKNHEIDNEQRWATVNRHEREVQEQLVLLEETLTNLQKEIDLSQRIQSAQADAMRKFPRIWLEEIEKARQQDPNRRRQPALISVREE